MSEKVDKRQEKEKEESVYQIGIGKKAWFWKNNIVRSGITLPLRLEKSNNHCFETKQIIFSLQELDEHIRLPHKIGNMIFFTEIEAKDICKKLEKILKQAGEKK